MIWTPLSPRAPCNRPLKPTRASARVDRFASSSPPRASALFFLHEMNVPIVIEIQKNDSAPAPIPGSWDMCREEEIRFGEDAQRGCWNDRSGPRSWLPLVDPDAGAAVFRIAPRRLVGKRSFWRSIELSSMPLRRALFLAIFGTSTPRQIMSRKMRGATVVGSCCFDAAEWSIGRSSERPSRGMNF